MKLSIIVPAYNSENHVADCIESIINQDYTDFELIIVNDGSLDNTLDIVNRESQIDERIKVVSISNSGVSTARNVGIKNSCGELITFIDSDDTIEPGYLTILVNRIIKSATDIVISGLRFTNGNMVKLESPKTDTLLNLDEDMGILRLFDICNLSTVVGKLYNRKIIDNHSIYFDGDMSYGEDRDFNLKYISKVKTAGVITYCGYNYKVTVPGSLSKSFNSNRLEYDYRYWNNMRYVLSQRYAIANQSNKLLTHLLFFFIVDNYIEISNHCSISDAIDIYNRTKGLVDWNFIKCNLQLVAAPKWQKILLKISSKLLLITFFVLKNRKLIK